MKQADNRPRVHIYPASDHVLWSLGPCATRHPAASHGDGLNRALEQLGKRAGQGVVVIVEVTHG